MKTISEVIRELDSLGFTDKAVADSLDDIKKIQNMVLGLK